MISFYQISTTDAYKFMINTIDEAEKALLEYSLKSNANPKDTTLERIKPLMDLLNYPYKNFKTIHIAGTSGKSSTAYYLASLLVSSDKKVGMTVSPHVDNLTERIQINGRPISEELFCSELNIFFEIIKASDIKPSYYELLYSFIIWVIARQNVDYAVIETGIGGLHDTSNVIDNKDKLCLITDVGFDHLALLGDTLEKIASQKIGIVHEANQAITYDPQSDSILKIFEDWVKLKDASLQILDEANQAELYADLLTGLPNFQKRNWLLAQAAYSYLRKRDGLRPLSSEEQLKTTTTSIPARMDIVKVGSKTLVMDGAHNPQKMKAFVDSFRQLYPNKKAAVMFPVKQADQEEVESILSTIASRVIYVTISNREIQYQRKAYRQLLNGPEDVCVITGSFYLLRQIRSNEFGQ